MFSEALGKEIVQNWPLDSTVGVRHFFESYSPNPTQYFMHFMSRYKLIAIHTPGGSNKLKVVLKSKFFNHKQ